MQHKERVEIQRKHYKETIENLENDSAALVIDFKENLKLNYKPNENSHSYYDAPLRTCFGAILKYKKDNKVYDLPIDIFSKILSHQTWFVIQTLDYISKMFCVT
jgi:hypothetical protein